jgi:hypothetical protein
MWVRFKDGTDSRKTWLNPEYLSIPEDQFKAMRSLVDSRMVEEAKDLLGSVPLTVTRSVLKDAGFDYGSGVDSFVVEYACYQTVKVCYGGAWEVGPEGPWHKFTSKLTEET